MTIKATVFLHGGLDVRAVMALPDHQKDALVSRGEASLQLVEGITILTKEESRVLLTISGSEAALTEVQGSLTESRLGFLEIQEA